MTVPLLDCSSVWLLILMLLLFSTYLSLPYGISHSTTTPYLLASYIILPHVSTRNISAWSTPSRGILNFSSQAYVLRIWGCEGGICNLLLGQQSWEGAERGGVVKDWLVGSRYQGRGRTSGFYTDSTIPSGIVCSSCGSRGGCRLGFGGSSDGRGSNGSGRLSTEADSGLESDHACRIKSCGGDRLGPGGRGRLRSESGGDSGGIGSGGGGQLGPGGSEQLGSSGSGIGLGSGGGSRLCAVGGGQLASVGDYELGYGDGILGYGDGILGYGGGRRIW